jgi:putative transcriptional regulator
MAGHSLIGASSSVPRGSLLVATPKLSSQPWRRSVIFVTESSPSSVMGVILNTSTMMTTADVTDYDVPHTQIYMGGPVSTSALYMLHTNDFLSSNTLRVTPKWHVSSDTFMFEKLSHGAQPAWYRFYMGVAGWHPRQLEYELESGAWMILEDPTDELITAETDEQWKQCVEHLGSQMFDQYI